MMLSEMELGEASVEHVCHVLQVSAGHVTGHMYK